VSEKVGVSEIGPWTPVIHYGVWTGKTIESYVRKDSADAKIAEYTHNDGILRAAIKERDTRLANQAITIGELRENQEQAEHARWNIPDAAREQIDTLEAQVAERDIAIDNGAKRIKWLEEKVAELNSIANIRLAMCEEYERRSPASPLPGSFVRYRPRRASIVSDRSIRVAHGFGPKDFVELEF
jgi:chromosome segregation ATPase